MGEAWFPVSPRSLSLSLSQSRSSDLRGCLPFFDLAPLSRNLSFIVFLYSDRIKLGFLCFSTAKVTDWPKNDF